jgi:hypothetical protein
VVQAAGKEGTRRICRNPFVKPFITDFPLRSALASGNPLQTRSLRSGGFNHSRSASELLHTQKTKLPRLSTVCSGQPDAASNDISGIIRFSVLTQTSKLFFPMTYCCHRHPLYYGSK